MLAKLNFPVCKMLQDWFVEASQGDGSQCDCDLAGTWHSLCPRALAVRRREGEEGEEGEQQSIFRFEGSPRLAFRPQQLTTSADSSLKVMILARHSENAGSHQLGALWCEENELARRREVVAAVGRVLVLVGGELSVGLRRRSLLGSGTGQHQILGNLVEMSDVLLCELPPVPCNFSLTELAVGARACPGTRARHAYARLVDRRLRGARLPRSCTDYLAVAATLRTHSPNTLFEVELLDQVLPALQLRCLKL
ncbi:hypothetical protein AK812_SmicGene31369 [Symbiodinium microadriaticum]|uniref:Uncharacterized protein n=1 Tax=Symbiodinium microadriaticum TaxID=2951 RepID=A0A1Q9CWW6_SYMMI|nr:hypothetical protein AK812_SmicGene31369 [Symbiodinium microadriaticum]